MRERLSSLSDEARSIRSQVPSEFHPDVERIQQQMQRLGERLAELSGSSRLLDDVRRAQPDEVILLGAPHKADDPWDQESASALTRFYESGDGLYATEPDNDPFDLEAVQAAGAGILSLRAPAQASTQAAARTQAAASEQQGWRGVEPAWLDQRFAEVARRIEEALAEIHPENSLLQLGNRFDLLEARMSAVLSNVATKADLKELRVAEGQIEDIGKQLGQLRRQLERLDAIDAHLGTLTEHLSDERFLRVLHQGPAHDDERLQAIDAQLASIGQQLAHDRLVESHAGREAMEAHSRDLGEVRGLIENLINERRHNDENNASMLETMQQAIIRVLDRIDAMELGQQQGAASTAPMMPPQQPQAAQPMPQPMASEPPVRYPPAMPGEAPLQGMAQSQAHMEDGPAEPEEQAAPQQPDSEYQIPRSSLFARRSDEPAAEQQPPFTIAPFDMDAAFAREPAGPSLSYGGNETPARSIDPLRHDFIADAHRAKLRAAAKLDTASDAEQARIGEMGAALDTSLDRIKAGTIKPRQRSSFFRSPRVLMGILTLLAMVPAALFFMPRVPGEAKAPATTNALPYYEDTAPHGAGAGGNGAIVPAHPDATDPVLPGDELPRKQSQRLESVPQSEPGSYQDASQPAPAAGYEQIDTASIPDRIALGSGAMATARQIAESKRGESGLTSPNATPAELMQEHLLRANGAVDGNPMALPPATVGPYSLRLAAAGGDASAQFEVASRLADDKSSEKNMKEALEWYQRSATAGFAMAQFRLGTLYERGLGVKADPARAQVWYTRAAEQGNVKAMHNLAVLIASRDGADYALAAKWFGEAAARGLPDSQFNLAVLYQNGLGVTKDLKEAYKWLLLAARSGDADSKARCEALKAELSAEDRAAGEAMSENWRMTPSNPVVNNFRAAGQAWQYGPSTIASRR